MPAKKAKKSKKKALRKSVKKVKRTPKRVAKPKKKAKRTAPKPASKPAKTSRKNVAGLVTHYFPHVNAAVIKVKKPIKVGDVILIKGHTTRIEQTIESMQIDHVPIQTAKKGDEIGLQVRDRVRDGDVVEIVK